MPSRSISLAAILICLFLLVKILDLSQSILIPFIFALLIWNLLSTIASIFQQVPVIGRWIPKSMAIMISFLLIFTGCFALGKILGENTQKMITSSLTLQQKLTAFVQGLASHGYTQIFQKILNEIHFQQWIVGFYSGISNLLSSLFLMMLFVIFFFVEQNQFSQKIEKMFPAQGEYQKVMHILKTIPQQIQFYLGLKTLFSLMTAVSIYLILKWMGLEFAAFWAVMVFFMNFIPNIGSILMTLVITLVAYFQWLDWGAVLILFIAQLVVHVLVGNLLETHYLGKTMHLSPLFLLLSLCFWGILWGTTGLFLAVPMTVLLMIILGSFQETRRWALLLSETGELPPQCDFDDK